MSHMGLRPEHCCAIWKAGSKHLFCPAQSLKDYQNLSNTCLLISLHLESPYFTESNSVCIYFAGFQGKEKRVTDKVLLTAFELLKDTGGRVIPR